MGLDFTSIPDRTGAALYVLHTGNSVELDRLERLKHDIETQDSHQVVLIDINTPDGEKVRDFYDLDAGQLPTALIIGDDDGIAFRWDGSAIPTAAGDIVYQLNRASA